MNSKILFGEIMDAIQLNEPAAEKQALAYLLLEEVSVSKADIAAGKDQALSASTRERLSRMVERLNQHEPVQYILGRADFFGRVFQVDARVLIPRPETEELAQLVINWCKPEPAVRVVDLGTGSGCLAITLALELPGSQVLATDVSEAALDNARGNADRLKAPVRFLHHDMLSSQLPLAALDVVVSNPPYIDPSERSAMARHVTDHEPHTALFTAEGDPLQFYRSIGTLAAGALRSGGLLALEVHEAKAAQVAALLVERGFDEVKCIRDLSGKERIVSATNP